jgi:hypothetical protein
LYTLSAFVYYVVELRHTLICGDAERNMLRRGSYEPAASLALCAMSSSSSSCAFFLGFLL